MSWQGGSRSRTCTYVHIYTRTYTHTLCVVWYTGTRSRSRNLILSTNKSTKMIEELPGLLIEARQETAGATRHRGPPHPLVGGSRGRLAVVVEIKLA